MATDVLSFNEIKDMVEITTDNEFDSDSDFQAILNYIILDLNTKLGTKFTRVTNSDVISNTNADYEEYTKIPRSALGALIKGLQLGLQRKEQDDDWEQYSMEYSAELDRIRVIISQKDDSRMNQSESTTAYTTEQDW